MPQADISAFEQKGTWQLPLSETVADIDLTDVEIITEDMPGWLVANDGSLTIALDIEVTEELIEEGIARELINRIQNIRKSSNFEITDKILIQIEQNAATDKAVEHFREYISSQVLAQQLDIVPQLTEAQDLDFEDFIVHINIKKA